MNPKPMNRGYRRLFWGAFFTLLWSGPFDTFFPWFPGIIGLYLCYSGTGFLLQEVDSARLKQAKDFSFAGAVIWTFQCVLVIPVFDEYIPWSLRFLSYILGAVILLQIYINVFIAAGEQMGESGSKKFSQYATAFTIVFTISTIGYMAFEFIGDMPFIIGSWYFQPFPLLQLVLAIWTMHVMAKLRRGYPENILGGI